MPILCVQHISPGFVGQLVDWLDRSCRLRVEVAVNGVEPMPGHVYFAPERLHLGLDPAGRIRLSAGEPEEGQRPAVNVLFRALAQQYGPATLAVLLTGMGRDGASGLLRVAEAGGHTIAQDEQSCVIFGMPKEAIALGAARQVLPLAEMAPLLEQLARGVGSGRLRAAT
ncbi:MAG: hypothetical protein C3L25_02065 [Candidatus Sedimenticola endophacoides]|nr:MAG: hypothetical protein C3L26_02070 [Candidatus Sedimenticola endophacoides]PUE05061.1 MAG: hypothetical protein C3L25_02065 [Candidatus Sedimenticola endophacoides]